MSGEFVQAVRAVLAGAADPARAPGMQAYMKSELPFLGVRAPEVRRIVRDALAAAPPPDWRAAVLELWRGAEYREERYAALAVLNRSKRHLTAGDLPLIEEIVVTGAWWDYVDAVAKLAGSLLPEVAGDMRRWSRDASLWKRRISIICQLGRRDATDLALLAHCIEANLDDPEFFVRKAIGWALRELGATNPAWVHAFVLEHEARLSPLSRREALKYLPRFLAERSAH